MLAQRIVTALVMLFVMVAALAAPGHAVFEWLMLAVVSAAVWEWGRLSGLTPRWSVNMAAVVALFMAWLLLGTARPAVTTTPAGVVSIAAGAFWWLVGFFWIVGGALVLLRGVDGWHRLPVALRLVIGVGLLLAAWLAITQAQRLGFNFLMSTLALIWVSDIAAYFGGRAWGGRLLGAGKLAPSISPGKTREGAVAGLVGALALALLWVLWIDPRWGQGSASLYTRLVNTHGWFVMGLSVAVLTAAGIVGDLFESLVKRAAGAKDSSRLLPGHGGVLDRIDALLPAVPMALAMAAWAVA